MRASVFGLSHVDKAATDCLGRDRHHFVGLVIDRQKVAAVRAGSVRAGSVRPLPPVHESPDGDGSLGRQ